MENETVKPLIVKAIIDTLRNPKRAALPKPTIDELEKILNSDEPPRIDIMPDGSITAELPVYASDLADAIIEVLNRRSE